jgi:hypothetical protein
MVLYEGHFSGTTNTPRDVSKDKILSHLHGFVRRTWVLYSSPTNSHYLNDPFLKTKLSKAAKAAYSLFSASANTKLLGE